MLPGCSTYTVLIRWGRSYGTLPPHIFVTIWYGIVTIPTANMCGGEVFFDFVLNQKPQSVSNVYCDTLKFM